MIPVQLIALVPIILLALMPIIVLVGVLFAIRARKKQPDQPDQTRDE